SVWSRGRPRRREEVATRGPAPRRRRVRYRPLTRFPCDALCCSWRKDTASMANGQLAQASPAGPRLDDTFAIACRRGVLHGAWRHQMVPGQQLELLRGDGPAEQVSLLHLAAAAQQEGGLQFRLDTFGDHLQSELVAQCDDGPGERAVPATGGDVGHEGAVDLQLIDGKELQVTQ